MSFKIGNIEIKNSIVLAPMAGISNPTYIKLCEGFGLGFAITELISAEAIVRDNKKTLDMLKTDEEVSQGIITILTMCKDSEVNIESIIKHFKDGKTI